MNKAAPFFRTFDFPRRVIGLAIAAGITALMLMIFLAVSRADIPLSSSSLQPDIPHLVRMSLIQAALTTALSLGVGIALAWALNRLRFFGRQLVVSLFATAIVAPAIVVALGVIALWGRAGWINGLLSAFSLDWNGSIFGLHGILLAHTILNGAFAAHILLARLETIPARKLKTAQSLALSPLRRFMVLDWPAISSSLPPLGAIIFLLAFTSFPIVLILGGGPANQTLEVAIYSYVRLSFDLRAALNLALVQLVLCLLIVLPALLMTPSLADAGTSRHLHWPDNKNARILQWLILLLALVGFGLPLLAVLVNGLGPGLFGVLVQPRFWQAALTSLSIGTASAILTLALALGLATARNSFASPLARTALALPAFAYLVIPALVLSLGFFLAVRKLQIPPADAAPFVLILANALLALPFAISVLAPALTAIDRRYRRTARSLALGGFTRWRLVEWPLMGRAVGIALAFGFCFSLGDLGVIALFGTSEFSTLPWLMFRALGAYRTNDAAAIASVLLLLTLVAFWALPPLMKKLSHARS
ncbi:MAG TPA: thiamine/thiamine pyrophosphate ABC transporter permease ThiP [Devosia sp.]|nr:thiamine/thiamine pyrophosphate ABC transporter permease ThiP [Devosia sp.]